MNLIKNSYQNILQNIIFAVTFTFLISACTPTTGTSVILDKFEPSSYQKADTLYIYRKEAFGGSLAQLFIEVNNEDVGTIGMGQIVSAKLRQGTNLLAAIGDINQRSYNYLLEHNSSKPQYFIASYEKSLLVKVTQAEWANLIAKDNRK